MTEPINLGAERVKRSNDCKDWTAAECLRDLLADVESGKIKPVRLGVMFTEETENGGERPGYSCYNCSHSEWAGFMALMMHKAIEDWKD